MPFGLSEKLINSALTLAISSAGGIVLHNSLEAKILNKEVSQQNNSTPKKDSSTEESKDNSLRQDQKKKPNKKSPRTPEEKQSRPRQTRDRIKN